MDSVKMKLTFRGTQRQFSENICSDFLAENPTRSMQAENFTTNVPKILHLKSSSEQIFSENCRWVPLKVSFILTLSME